MKSTSKKSFQMSGPLRSVRVSGGAHGVKVALNGRDVVNVRNAQPDLPGGPTAKGFSQSPDDDLSTIALGRYIAEQQPAQPAAKPTDDGNDDDGQGIVVGPITPIPSPKPIPSPRPARLGL